MYLKERDQLLIDQRVAAQLRHKLLLLLSVRQVAVQQKVAAVAEVAQLCKLVDGVAAVQEDPRRAVDEGKLAGAAGRGAKARVVRANAGPASRIIISAILATTWVIHSWIGERRTIKHHKLCICRAWHATEWQGSLYWATRH